MHERNLTARGGGALMPLTWPLERILFALAGTMILFAAFLAALVSPWFLLAAFVGLNQWLYVILGACPASLVLARLAGKRSCVVPSVTEAMYELWQTEWCPPRGAFGSD
jgi:hypothetical protein